MCFTAMLLAKLFAFQVGLDSSFFTKNKNVTLAEARDFVLYQRLTTIQVIVLVYFRLFGAILKEIFCSLFNRFSPTLIFWFSVSHERLPDCKLCKCFQTAYRNVWCKSTCEMLFCKNVFVVAYLKSALKSAIFCSSF